MGLRDFQYCVLIARVQNRTGTDDWMAESKSRFYNGSSSNQCGSNKGEKGPDHHRYGFI